MHYMFCLCQDCNHSRARLQSSFYIQLNLVSFAVVWTKVVWCVWRMWWGEKKVVLQRACYADAQRPSMWVGLKLAGAKVKIKKVKRFLFPCFLEASTHQILWRPHLNFVYWTHVDVSIKLLTHLGASKLNPLIHKLCKLLLIHNMGQKWPVFISCVISCMAGCFFALFFYSFFFHFGEGSFDIEDSFSMSSKELSSCSRAGFQDSPPTPAWSCRTGLGPRL